MQFLIKEAMGDHKANVPGRSTNTSFLAGFIFAFMVMKSQ
jgi:hypothetical protein